MSFEIFKAFPPDRESPVAQLCVHDDEKLSIPAEIARDDGVLMITIFQPGGGIAWTYPLNEWLEAIQRGVDAL